MEHMDGKLDRDGNRIENPDFPPGDLKFEGQFQGQFQGQNNDDRGNIDRSREPRPSTFAEFASDGCPGWYFLRNGLPVPPEYWTEYERQTLLGRGRERARD